MQRNYMGENLRPPGVNQLDFMGNIRDFILTKKINNSYDTRLYYGFIRIINHYKKYRIYTRIDSFLLHENQLNKNKKIFKKSDEQPPKKVVNME